MKNPVLLTTFLASTTALTADPIEETRLFVIQASSITDVAISTFATGGGIISDMDNQFYGGDFQADFTFDRNTLEVERFEFTGQGEMTTDPYGLFMIGFVDYPPSRSTTVERVPQPFVTSQTKFIPETRDGFEGLVNSDGTLDNLNYRVKAYSGGYSFTWAIQGNGQNPTIVTYNDINPSILPYRGVSTPSIEEVSSTVHELTLQAYLTIELDESEIVTLSGKPTFPDLDIVETEAGTVTGKTGQFKINTDYGDWSDENSPIVKLDPEDTNDAGISYGILYALDLPADTTSLPISIANTPAGPVTTIVLPEGGLRNPLGVEYTDDLSATDWPELPDANYVDGTDSLDLGATGDPDFTFPADTLGFMRFTTVVE
ncbi:MAG: hypothetical protein AAGI48_04605 [Verrucomicrobiota bacterium]